MCGMVPEFLVCVPVNELSAIGLRRIVDFNGDIAATGPHGSVVLRLASVDTFLDLVQNRMRLEMIVPVSALTHTDLTGITIVSIGSGYATISSKAHGIADILNNSARLLCNRYCGTRPAGEPMEPQPARKRPARRSEFSDDTDLSGTSGG